MIPAVSDSVCQSLQRLAQECQECYQCGQCTSACPNGWDLTRGPRLVMRLLLSRDIEKICACEDIWRCSECGACSRACPMKIDVAEALARLRMLELEHGALRCPEREAARIAITHLARRRDVDNMVFGLAMVTRGFLPWDLRAAVGAAAQAVGRLVPRPWRKSPAATPTEANPKRLFAGCSLRQDPESSRLTHEVSAALGIPIAEANSAGCCGHPARGAMRPRMTGRESCFTVCPGCESSLRSAGIPSEPLWESLVSKARRDGRRLSALAPGYVPYVGCLGDRYRALEALGQAAELSGTRMHMAYPSLQASCCGALGGMFRGETKATVRLLAFADERGAPVVTTCLLCRENLRSAARRRYPRVSVHFWPEFFRATPTVPPLPQGESHVR